MKKILKAIFSIKNNGDYKLLQVLGIKIKFRSEKLFIRNKLNSICNNCEEIKSYIIASKMHSYLEKYRGCYEGKDVVIVGCGPTLEFFEPIKNAVYIGINRAFKSDKVCFDYLFASDHFPEGMDEFSSYRNEDCEKFITYWLDGPNRVKLSDLVKIKKLNRLLWGAKDRMPHDIAYEPFGSYGYFATSVIAAQFALYTLPKKIYLVGMDCTIKNIYRDTPTPFFDGTYHNNVDGWKMLKKDVDDKYPGIEIISVNPVGLKGLFNDVYTQSYVNNHTELLQENIRILNQEEELCIK